MTHVTLTFDLVTDLKIYQDVELITGNMHTEFEKDLSKGVNFRGQVKVL